LATAKNACTDPDGVFVVRARGFVQYPKIGTAMTVSFEETPNLDTISLAIELLMLQNAHLASLAWNRFDERLDIGKGQKITSADHISVRKWHINIAECTG
jgi:hypothetical protein